MDSCFPPPPRMFSPFFEAFLSWRGLSGPLERKERAEPLPLAAETSGFHVQKRPPRRRGKCHF